MSLPVIVREARARGRADGASHAVARAGARLTGARWLAVPLGLFVATRGLVWIVALISHVLVPLDPTLSILTLYPESPAIDLWTHGDGPSYLLVAQSGYWFDRATFLRTPPVLPALPVLASLGSQVVGDPAPAALLIVNLAFALGLIATYRLLAAARGPATATRALLLLCVFPFAFRFSAVDPRALVFLLAALTFLALEAHRPWEAAACAAVAALAHPLGLALWPALIAARIGPAGGQPSRAGARWAWASLALPPLVVAAFGWFLYTAASFSFPRIAATFLGIPGLDASSAGPAASERLLAAVGVALAFLALLTTRRVTRLLGPPYAVYLVGIVGIALPNGLANLGSAVLLAFPAFLVAAELLRAELLEALAISVSALFLGIGVAAFVSWQWIGPPLVPPSILVSPPDALASFHARLVRRGVPASQLPRNLYLTADHSILFLGYDQPRARYAPGDTIPVSLDFFVLQWTDRGYLLSARLYDRSGRQVAATTRTLWGQADRDLFSPARTPTLAQGHYFGERWDVPIDPHLPAGLYTLDVRLFRDPSFALVPLENASDQPVDVLLREPVIVASPGDLGSPDAFSPRHPLRVTLGNAIELLGYDQSPPDAHGVIQVALYWEARTRPTRDATVFVQVLDPAGQVVAQSDSYPADGRFPTSFLAPGDVLRDVHTLTLPAPRPRGPLRLIAGMYQLQTMQRLAVRSAATGAASDHVDLGTLEGAR